MVHLTAHPVIRYRDAEKETRAYLAPFLNGLRVATRVPSPRPAKWLRVIRTGGARENRFVDRPQITLEAWAETETDALNLLEDARAYLTAAQGRIFGVEEVSGPANLPDPTTAQIRYTMSLWLRIRGYESTGD